MKRNRFTAVLTFAVCLIVIVSMAVSACRKQPSSGDSTAEPAADNNTPIPTVELTPEPEATDGPVETATPVVTPEPTIELTEGPATTDDGPTLIDNGGDIVIEIPTDQGSGGL